MRSFSKSALLFYAVVVACVCLVGASASALVLTRPSLCWVGPGIESSCPILPDRIDPDGRFLFEGFELASYDWFSIPAGRNLRFETVYPYVFSSFDRLPYAVQSGSVVRPCDGPSAYNFVSGFDFEEGFGYSPQCFELWVPMLDLLSAPTLPIRIQLSESSVGPGTFFSVISEQPESLAASEFIAPVVEDFERLIDPAYGQPIVAPVVGSRFPSGLVFDGPSRDWEGVSPFTVAEEAGIEPFGFDVEGNGYVGDSSFLSSGTGFAAPYGLPTHTLQSRGSFYRNSLVCYGPRSS